MKTLHAKPKTNSQDAKTATHEKNANAQMENAKTVKTGAAIVACVFCSA